jgi:predicted dehydrogenase
VTAIADIRPYNIFRALHGDKSSDNALKVRPGLIAKYDWKTEDAARKNVKVYDGDYRELLKDPEIEAVVIAVPLHLHAEVAINAMRAGKHVLTEKLMGHDIGQCKDMSRISYEEGRLLATGHQRHYNVLYESSVELIRMGLLGDLHFIRAQWHRGNLPGKDSWSPPLPGEIAASIANKKTEIERVEKDLATLNSAQGKSIQQEIKFSLEKFKLFDSLKKRKKDLLAAIEKDAMKALDANVDAKNYGYEERMIGDYKRTALEELIRWRLWDRTGGGLMAELGSHQLDASGIFVSAMRADGHKVLPLSVTGVGVRSIFGNDRDCDDHVFCTFEYPGNGYYKDGDAASQVVENPEKKVVVTYSSINGNGFGGYGEVVMGTKGTLILETESDVILSGVRGSSTGVKVGEKDGKPVLDTTSSGAPEAVASNQGPVSRGYTEEMEHFAWCIRNFDQAEMKAKKDQYENNPRCHPKVALADAVIALTSNVSMGKQEKIAFKHEWFDIASDETPDGSKPGEKKYS